MVQIIRVPPGNMSLAQGYSKATAGLEFEPYHSVTPSLGMGYYLGFSVVELAAEYDFFINLITISRRPPRKDAHVHIIIYH